MALKSGDVLEAAIWMDGTETEEMKQRFENDLREGMKRMAEESKVMVGALVMTEKKPGDHRVPPVPDNVQGPNVRLLVGEAEVIGPVLESESLFVADLEPKDLERLRTILRRVYRAWNPGKPELSNERCDEFINQNGPDAALEALREQVGVKVN